MWLASYDSAECINLAGNIKIAYYQSFCSGKCRFIGAGRERHRQNFIAASIKLSAAKTGWFLSSGNKDHIGTYSRNTDEILQSEVCGWDKETQMETFELCTAVTPLSC